MGGAGQQDPRGLIVRGAPDVVVVGSGAAGLAAALAASVGGANVLVVERSDAVGGTTALSGGVVWAPANHLMRRAGIADTEADALGYLDRIDIGGDPRLRSDFVSHAGRIIEVLEELTPLRFELLDEWPDYHCEEPGGLRGGRSVWPAPIEVPRRIASKVQTGPELSGADPLPDAAQPASLHPSPPAPSNDGVVFRGPVRGRVLVGALLWALESRGVEVRLATRAGPLVFEAGGVRGVEVEGDLLSGRVVIATGGFQHDPGLAGTFLRAPGTKPMGAPGCAGDGLRMALSAGAALGNMSEGWWMPAMHVPGEEIEGSPHYRALHAERAQPGSVMVDRSGRRFVDEAQNYGDVGRAMQSFRPEPDWFPALPCWLVFDAGYRARTPVGPIGPGDPDPEWLTRAGSLHDLARATAMREDTLVATVERFNENAARGEDPDFARGERHYDRWIGNPCLAHPTLGALDDPPFYALRVECGCMGTKGGPVTDGSGRVLGTGRRVIENLYAAGNAAANPFGIATPAGGSTLGPALVFGTRAGEAAACDR
jgi:3-oxosteroid 1-dehydrogenase